MPRVRLRWHPFVAGGVLKVGACTQKPGILSSRPTAGGVMVHDCDYGNWNYKSFLMKLGFHFRYVIFLQAPGNGKRKLRAQQVSWRLELHHSTQFDTLSCYLYLLPPPKSNFPEDIPIW